MIFIACSSTYFALQSDRPQAKRTVQKILALLRLRHDFFEEIEIGSERLSPSRRQRVSRDAASAFHAFGERHVTRLMQGPKMCGHVAISHLQCVANLGERELRRRGEQRHDREPSLLVD